MESKGKKEKEGEVATLLFILTLKTTKLTYPDPDLYLATHRKPKT